MRKLKLGLLTGIWLLISAAVYAGNPPVKVQETFEKMYPKVTNTEWTRKSDYHIAEFAWDNHEISVWFGNNAQWIMTETNVETLEEVPAPVAKAYLDSPLTAMRLRYIRIITFPKMPTVIIIDAEQYNSEEEFQLFYAPNGTLLQNLNVTGGNGEIYPELFG